MSLCCDRSYGGEYGGQATAEVLAGEYNPGGATTLTWYPEKFGQPLRPPLAACFCAHSSSSSSSLCILTRWPCGNYQPRWPSSPTCRCGRTARCPVGPISSLTRPSSPRSGGSAMDTRTRPSNSSSCRPPAGVVRDSRQLLIGSPSDWCPVPAPSVTQRPGRTPPADRMDPVRQEHRSGRRQHRRALLRRGGGCAPCLARRARAAAAAPIGLRLRPGGGPGAGRDPAAQLRAGPGRPRAHRRERGLVQSGRLILLRSCEAGSVAKTELATLTVA